MSRHEKLLDRAIGVALTSECRWRHGAVLTRGSKIMAWSTNIYRNSSEIDYEGATFHAEEAALREFDRLTGATYGVERTKGLTLYIARVNAKGDAGMSRPCVDCFDILTYRGIRDIVYTNSLGRMSYEQTF